MFLASAAAGFDPTGFLPYVTGASGALFVLLVWVWFLVSGKLISQEVHDKVVSDKDQQIHDLTLAVEREREASRAAILAAQTSRDVLQALHQEVSKK